MGVPGSANFLLAGAQGYQIERSLRFNSPDTAYLSKIVGAGGGTTKNAVSFWVKRSALGTQQALFQGRQDANNQQYIGFTTSNAIELGIFTGGSYVLQKITSAVYRDTSAWYHVFFYQDNTLATAEDRYQLYINGVRVTAWSTNTNTATQSNAYYFGSNVQHYIAAFGGASTLDGYLTEFHFIYQPTTTPLVGDFGETDTITGVWKPKRYSGTYGTNGFYLKFADNSGTTSTTLGKDSSGNGNNWTPNNFSVTAGAGNDSLIDTPTPYADGGNGRGNYCTLNPLDNGGLTLANGNLDGTYTTTAWRATRASIGISSGKWYWEITSPDASTSTSPYRSILTGIAKSGASLTVGVGQDANGWGYFNFDGTKYTNNTSSAYGTSWNSTNTIGVAFDADNGTLTFYRDNTSQGTAFTGLTSGPYFPAVSCYGSVTANMNFGQRAFAYTPPSGFKALNTQNLPEPSIKKPNQWMDATTYTGTSASNAIVNAGGFQPDLVWLKNRNYAPGTNHVLVDAVRGVSLGLASNLTNAEFSTVGNFSSINSNGFTVTGTTRDYNFLNDTFVAWQWKESATPGFDIVTYTGDGTTSANRLIDHSLGVKPDFVVTKKRSGGTDYGWSCWHKDLGGNYGIWLDKTSARNVGMWGGYSNFSATKFTPPDLLYGNENGATYVNYLWSEVAGFSKFGSYTGNGSSDGPFVFCGFQPKVLLIKSSSSGYDWFIFDDARNTYNAVDLALFPNVSGAESGGSTYLIDFTSNGFKLRNTQLNLNGSGNTYIFAAWAEFPAKYSLAR